jgi:hypothetical protein
MPLLTELGNNATSIYKHCAPPERGNADQQEMEQAMGEETIQDLTTEDFNQLIDDFVAREDDRIEPSVFLPAMAELQRARVVEVNGSDEETMQR